MAARDLRVGRPGGAPEALTAAFGRYLVVEHSRFALGDGRDAPASTGRDEASLNGAERWACVAAHSSSGRRAPAPRCLPGDAV